MIEPYQYASGDAHGDEPEKAVPTYGSSKSRRLTLADRARLGARRRREDPSWGSKTPESRRRLLEQDKREEGR